VTPAQRPTRPFGEPAPVVQLPALLRTAGGGIVSAPVVITNSSSAPRIMLVTAMGVDAAWLPLPQRSPVVAPGSSVELALPVAPAMGTLPARYPFVVTVQALDPADERVTSPASIAESVLLVDAPGSVDLSLEPADASAVFRRYQRHAGALLAGSKPRAW